jgi:hypothetical protein
MKAIAIIYVSVNARGYFLPNVLFCGHAHLSAIASSQLTGALSPIQVRTLFRAPRLGISKNSNDAGNQYNKRYDIKGIEKATKIKILTIATRSAPPTRGKQPFHVAIFPSLRLG